MSNYREGESWQGNRWGGRRGGGGGWRGGGGGGGGYRGGGGGWRGGGNNWRGGGGGGWRGKRQWNRNRYGNSNGRNLDEGQDEENNAETFPLDFHSRNLDSGRQDLPVGGREDPPDDGSNAFSVPESEISEAGSFRNPALNFVVESNALDLLCPFKGWPIYFPNEHYGGDKSETHLLIEACTKYLKFFAEIYDPEAIADDLEFFVDIQDLIKAESLTNVVENIAQKIVDRPEIFIRSLGIAMYNLVLQVKESQSQSLLGPESRSRSRIEVGPGIAIASRIAVGPGTEAASRIEVGSRAERERRNCRKSTQS